MGSIQHPHTPHHKKSYESRIDWTLCHQAKQKTGSFIGVVHLACLARLDGLFWVEIYLAGDAPIRLRLQAKDGLKDSFFCELGPAPFGRYQGQLLIAGIPLIARLQPDRHPQTGARRFRVHFTPKDSRA